MDPGDLYEMTALSASADRVLPNGLCLLPPAQNCDRGDACLLGEVIRPHEHQHLRGDS